MSLIAGPKKMSEVEVRLITSAETLPVRWPVLRAGLPPESAVFDGDDAPETRHLGAFRADALVGVVSIYPREFPERPDLRNCWQLRGMAVVPEAQRQGIGEALLKASIDEARRHGGDSLWCNARVCAAAFYQKHGWTVLGPEFDIPTAGPHVRMWRTIGSA